MAEFQHTQSKFAGADPNYFDHLQKTISDMELETAKQRQQAREVFDRVMHEGAHEFGWEWYGLHEVMRNVVEDAEYLPEGSYGDVDERTKAFCAEIALAVLSKYELKPRIVNE